jgi:hypothetical protein
MSEDVTGVSGDAPGAVTADVPDAATVDVPDAATAEVREHPPLVARRRPTWQAVAVGSGPRSQVLRGLVATCVILNAVIHLDLWAAGMKDLSVVGPAFLLNGFGGIAIGLLVLVWRHWLPLLGAIGFGLATLTAFIISTTPAGFFEVHEEWSGLPILMSATSEILAVILAVGTLLVERADARRTPSA